MKNEIDLEKDFADAKAVCASKMLKNNRSFIEFCNARAQAFVKNYMKNPTWEWDFNSDDIADAKELTFDAWYKKIDIRDYFTDAWLLKKLLTGLSADEVKILLCSEMQIFYDVFSKDVENHGAAEEEEEEDGDGDGDGDASKKFKDALDDACGLLKSKPAQNTEKPAEHCSNGKIGVKLGKDKADEDKSKDEQNYDDDRDFLCADLEGLFKSLHKNINSLTKELQDILSEEENEGKKEEGKGKGDKKKNEDKSN